MKQANATHQAWKFKGLIEHHGKNCIIVWNDEKLKIVAPGSFKLKTPNLHDVFYVPNVTKNLLGVRKLATDNNILVEFDKKLMHCEWKFNS